MFILLINFSVPLTAGKFEVESSRINRKFTQTTEDKLESLYSKLQSAKTHIDKVKVLHQILEYKFVNNMDCDKDIVMLRNNLKGLKYGELHAKSDYLTGNLEKINGKGNDAIKHYLKALKYYTDQNNKDEMARMNLAIGENLRAFAEQERALTYLRMAKGLTRNEKINADIDDRFSAVFFEMSYSHSAVYRDSSMIYALKAEQYALRENDSPLLLSALNILGALERAKKNLEKSKEYLFRAKEVAEKTKRTADLSLIHSNIARLYEDMNDIADCMKHAKIAYDLALKSNIKIYIVMSSQILYQMYKRVGNYKETLKYYEVYIDYRDQLYTEDKNRQIALVIANTELENKKKENELLKRHKYLQDTIIKKQKQNQIYLMAVILLITLFSSVIFYYSRKLQKINKQLKEEHLKVLQLEKIRSAYAMAITANHELNQPLMVLKGRLELLEMSFDEYQDKQIKHIRKIEEAYDQIIRILEKYRHNHSSIHFELYTDDEEMVVFDEDSDNDMNV